MTMTLSSLFRIAAVVMLTASLGGCAAAVGGGAATGIAASQERGLEEASYDLKLEMKIADKWLNHDKMLPVKVSVEVYEGRALLTGVIDNQETRADAVRLAWEVAGVKDVLNEIQVTGSSFMDMARDSWITAKLKSMLTIDENVMAINYAIETVNGVVYLIGIAQDQAELDRVVSQARDIEYVRKVINHVRVKEKT